MHFREFSKAQAMLWPPVALFCFLTIPVASPQAVIPTTAGTEWVFPGDGKRALQAPIDQAYGITLDLQGNPVFSDLTSNVVSRLNPDGTLTVLAGNGLPGFSGDGGPAVNASLSGPKGVVFDSKGNLYIADGFNDRIRRVTPDGIISTYAGGGRSTSLGDGGPAAFARLSDPYSVVVDSAGNLYICDLGNL